MLHPKKLMLHPKKSKLRPRMVTQKCRLEQPSGSQSASSRYLLSLWLSLSERREKELQDLPCGSRRHLAYLMIRLDSPKHCNTCGFHNSTAKLKTRDYSKFFTWFYSLDNNFIALITTKTIPDINFQSLSRANSCKKTWTFWVFWALLQLNYENRVFLEITMIMVGMIWKNLINWNLIDFKTNIRFYYRIPYRVNLEYRITSIKRRGRLLNFSIFRGAFIRGGRLKEGGV